MMELRKPYIIPVNDHVWLLNDDHMASCYVIDGTRQAAVIDTSIGLSNIREAAESLTSLPLRNSVDTILRGHCQSPCGAELFDTLLAALEDLAAGNTADDIDYEWLGFVSKAHPYQPNNRRIVYKS